MCAANIFMSRHFQDQPVDGLDAGDQQPRGHQHPGAWRGELLINWLLKASLKKAPILMFQGVIFVSTISTVTEYLWLE